MPAAYQEVGKRERRGNGRAGVSGRLDACSVWCGCVFLKFKASPFYIASFQGYIIERPLFGGMCRDVLVEVRGQLPSCGSRASNPA